MYHLRTGLPLAALLLGTVCGQAATTVSGSVSGHWPAGTYRVTGDLSVSAADTLSLAPGAVLKFLPGTGLACNGTLLAPGTADSLVVFTGRDDNTHGEILFDSDGTPAPGDWDGVYCYGYLGNLGSGHLEHALLRYGGGHTTWQANLYSHYSDLLVVERTRSEHSLQDGMRVLNGTVQIRETDFHSNSRRGLQGQSSAIVTVLDCAFTENGSDAARLTGISPVHLGGNGGSGNGQDGLALDGSINGLCLLEANDAGLPFVLSGELSGGAADSLRITAGTVIKGEGAGAIASNGVLQILGTEESPVVMTSLHDDSVDGDTNNNGGSTSPAPGDWIGLYCYGYLGNPGILVALHLGVLYAGAGSRAAGLYLSYPDSALLEGCEFSHSLVSGLRSANGAPVVTGCTFDGNLGNGILGSNSPVYIQDCGFTGNALYAARLDGTPGDQGGGNSGSGNGSNGIGLSGTAGGSLSWAANDPGFCYLLTGTLTMNAGDTLALEAGTVVKGVAGSQLRVNGILLCPGTESEPIVFTSHNDDSAGGDTHGDGAGVLPQPGDWQGVYLYGYLGNQGSATLDWCGLRYGGATLGATLQASYCDLLSATDSHFDHGSGDGVSTYFGATAFLRCSFQGNLASGLYHETGTAPTLHDCDFSGNGTYGALLTSIQNDYGNNSGTGNGINGLAVQGTVEHNTLWQANAPGFPYILKADLTVFVDDTLSLGPGLLFKAQPAAELQVNGVLHCLGTSADPVDFTSLKDDAWGGDTNGDGAGTAPAPGDWEGLYFYGYLGNQGSGLLQHTRLRYGGAAPLGSLIRLEYSDDWVLSHGDLSSSAGTGLAVSLCNPRVDHSGIHENTGYGVRVNSGTPTFGSPDQTLGGYNRFWGNGGGHQFYNASLTAIDAYFNDWGVYDSAAIDALIRDDNEAAVGEVRFAPFILESGPPQFLSIVAYPNTQTVRLFWTPVLDAIAYKVYTSVEPWGPWVEDTGGVFNDASWTAPWSVNRRFFRVVAITE